MRVFVSWSGVRSQAVAVALRAWLPQVIDGIELFHSEDIPKGSEWHAAIVDALRDCPVGIFCITPESLRSQWLHFEAGALAQHGQRPALFTYLYGVRTLEGPLGHFQATRFDRDDSRRFVRSLAVVVGAADDAALAQRFDATWPAFEAAVDAGTLVSVEQLLPGFVELFEDKKTFHEPFPDCSDTRWDDRLRRTCRTHAYLSQPGIEEVLAGHPYLEGVYDDLLAALDRYDMHIGAYLLRKVEFGDLREDEQNRLEDARKHILATVSAFRKRRQPPLFRESLAFESERSADRRKDRIHALEARLRSGGVPAELLSAPLASLDWSLDRIVYYLAFGLGLMPHASFDDVVYALRTEEERARTRELVTGLQPLYYAAEAVDETMPAPLAPATAARLLEIGDDIARFLDGHRGRDSGGHIRRRLASMRAKLAWQAPEPL